MHHWFEVCEIDNHSDVFEEIGSLWARAISASVDAMTVEARATWRTKLAVWATELSDYNREATFAPALGTLGGE